MKGICHNTITPILGSFVDYHKQRSYDRMVDLLWTLKHIVLKYI